MEKKNDAMNSQRLVKKHYGSPESWAPSISYKYSLSDVANQLTPAEAYRAKLAEDGKSIREIQRLERRYAKKLFVFVSAAIKVQSLFRGIKGRLEFENRKEVLILTRSQRVTYANFCQLFSAGRFPEAAVALRQVTKKDARLMMCAVKVSYQLRLYEQCEEASLRLIEMDPMSNDAYFMLACSFAARGHFANALKHVSSALDLSKTVQSDFFRLKAFVCCKEKKFAEAVETFNFLIEKVPEDLNLRLERAYCLSYLHEWKAARDDLDFIQYYQPDLAPVLHMRARVHCCLRQFRKATADLMTILTVDADNKAATEALRDIDQPSEAVPCFDDKSFDVT